MRVYVKIAFSNDARDKGVLRGSVNLPSVPVVGSKVKLNQGGQFYAVEEVLQNATTGNTTVSLGNHNLAARTVRTLQGMGFSKSRS